MRGVGGVQQISTRFLNPPRRCYRPQLWLMGYFMRWILLAGTMLGLLLPETAHSQAPNPNLTANPPTPPIYFAPQAPPAWYVVRCSTGPFGLPWPPTPIWILPLDGKLDPDSNINLRHSSVPLGYFQSQSLADTAVNAWLNSNASRTYPVWLIDCVMGRTLQLIDQQRAYDYSVFSSRMNQIEASIPARIDEHPNIELQKRIELLEERVQALEAKLAKID